MEFYRTFRPLIRDHLDPIDLVIDNLISEELITNANYEDITSQKKASDKIRTMLDILEKRRCPPQKFMHILKISENDTLIEMISKISIKKESDKTETPERKMYIFEGYNQNDTLKEYFSQSRLFKKLGDLRDELKLLPDNRFTYIDTIVLCNHERNNLQVKDLESSFVDIEKILSDHPERVFTFLLVVEGGEEVRADKDDGKNCIIKVLNTESLDSFLHNFDKNKETFDVYVRKVIQGLYMDKGGNRRKMFFLCNSNDATRDHLSKFQQLPMYEAQIISSLQEIVTAPPTDYKYYDIIAWCWNQIANIQNHHLDKIIRDIVTFEKIPQEISTTFLLLVDGSSGGGGAAAAAGGDNIDARVVVDESEYLIAQIPKHNFDKFLNGFLDNKNNFNSYVEKTAENNNLDVKLVHKGRKTE